MVAPCSPKRTQVATLLTVALLATALVPLGVVSADDDPTPDGFVIVLEPAGGDLADGKLFVDAASGVYSFHVSVFLAADGGAFPVTQWGAVVLGPDALHADTTETDLCPASGNPGCIYTTGGTNPDADHTFTINIPVAALAMRGALPGNGVGLYVVLHKDGAGGSLATSDSGRPPSGYYNPATAELVARGDFAGADAADEAGYPIVLRNAFLEDLVQPGNPVLNPGFEVAQGAALPGTLDSPVEEHGFSSEIAPWFLFIDSGPGTSTTPASTHFLATDCGAPGASGSCASIHVAEADFTQNLLFGQFFAPPGSGVGVWRVAGDLGLEFDTRTSHSYGWRATATVHYLDALTGAEQQQTRSLGSGVPGGYGWTHVSYDFDIPNGSILTSVLFSLKWDWNGAPIVLFDNVRLSGATLVPEPTLRNDLNDGHSAFLLPLGAAAGPTGVVSQSIQSLNGGDYYVYEVAAESHLDGEAASLPMADGLPFRFEILKQDHLADGERTDADLHFQSSDLLRLVDAEGNVLDAAYVLVPADVVAGPTRVFPWMFKDVAENDAYRDTFGHETEPVSAYHSLLRNAMRGQAVADAFDAAATPVVLTDTIGGSLTRSTSLTLECSGATPGQACLSDPTPRLVADLTTESRVLETLTVELVAASDPSLVLATGAVQTPGGSLELQLDEEDMTRLRDGSTDLRVLARTSGALFAAPAKSNAVRLDNLVPVAEFNLSPSADLTPLSVITVEDASSDLDGSIERRTWTVRFLTDPTDDLDDQTANSTVVAYPDGDRDANLRSFSFRVPDDGEYEIVLTSQDNDGAHSTTAKTFFVHNVAPTGTLQGPTVARPDQELTFAATLVDPDGFLDASSVAWSLGSANGTVTATDTRATVRFVEDGEHTVTVTFRDDDGANGSVSTTVVVDGVGPTTFASIPAAPTTGWFTGPVPISVSRTDDRSGVASTRTSVDGTSVINVPGAFDFVRTEDREGRHVFVATSTDRAGNVGTAAMVAFNIDTQPPKISLTTPTSLPGLPFYTWFRGDKVTLSANAVDAVSQVKQVSFHVDGRLIATDTDGSDGWSVLYDTKNDTGPRQITAIAIDHAGHAATSGSRRAFILDV